MRTIYNDYLDNLSIKAQLNPFVQAYFESYSRGNYSSEQVMIGSLISDLVDQLNMVTESLVIAQARQIPQVIGNNLVDTPPKVD